MPPLFEVLCRHETGKERKVDIRAVRIDRIEVEEALPDAEGEC